MVEVTEADKQMVADYLAAISINMPNLAALILANESALARCFATHREAAAKAERDRLRAQASLEKIARSIGRETVARDDRGILFDDLPEEDKATVLEMLAAALADALESQHD